MSLGSPSPTPGWGRTHPWTCRSAWRDTRGRRCNAIRISQAARRRTPTRSRLSASRATSSSSSCSITHTTVRASSSAREAGRGARPGGVCGPREADERDLWRHAGPAKVVPRSESSASFGTAAARPRAARGAGCGLCARARGFLRSSPRASPQPCKALRGRFYFFNRTNSATLS